MSKQLKRKITVNLAGKSKALLKTRPSVFERLGTKASSLHSKEFCHHWAQSGTCPYGKGCKYSSTHTLTSPSKQRAAKTQSESKRRHGKEGHKRVRTGDPNEDWDQWNPEELEDADPDDLEKRRQELQRELELQMKMDNKAHKKDKKVKQDSSPSTDSSSTSSESSSSSEESSSTSSSSIETKKKKAKKTKSKRDSSSSSDERGHKHKEKNKRNHSKSSAHQDKIKKSPKAVKVVAKSPTPLHPRKQSQTPPPKIKVLPTCKVATSETKSPRPTSRSSGKEKHRTPSPKTKEKEKEREREKEREKEKEREREKEKEREKEREREREKAKERERTKEREKERDYKRRERSPPKRDAKTTRDSNSKRRDTPDSAHSRDRKSSPGRSRLGNNRKDHKSPMNKDDHRGVKRDDRDRSRQRERVDPKNRKDRRDSRDRERERERERERRVAREEREAAREKEREEALARCQERQRERERLKELAKKEDERNRIRDRSRRDDRGLDKPTGDRERLLPLPDDRIPQARKAHSNDRDRNDRRERDRRDRTPDNRNVLRKSVERHDRLDRDIDKEQRVYDRSFDRSSDRAYDRDRERDHERDREREFPSMPPRVRDNERRFDEKDYDSPYDRTRLDDRRYLDVEEHYNDNSRDDRLPIDNRDYPEDRRSRRDLWDMGENRDIDCDRELDHRRYAREDSRPPGSLKGRDWDPEFSEHEWNRRAEWDARDNWDNIDLKHATEEEWRMYNNRSVDNWPADDRRRWPTDWREHSRPRSVTSHNRDEEPVIDTRRKETSVRAEPVEHKPITEPEVVAEATPIKRAAEEPLASPIEAKKTCIESVLEDDLSEISDDADEILNRDEEIIEETVEDPIVPETVETSSIKEQNSATSQKSQSPSRSPPNRLPKEESIDEENMDLDFEEISEDELEEESRVKGIGDALGVDWASLVAESRPRIKPVSSVKKRWESHNILANLGISVDLAGEELVREILKDHAQAELQEQQLENKPAVSIKLEATVKLEQGLDEDTNGIIMQTIKQEPDDQLEALKMESDDVIISHPLAAIQVAIKEKQNIRKSLFAGVGPYRRALSARRDLMIRRHLCNLPIKDTYVEAPKRHDPELFKIATQLFERSL